jgi:hypothetical protein
MDIVTHSNEQRRQCDVLAVEVDDDTWAVLAPDGEAHGRTLDDEVKIYLSELYRRNLGDGRRTLTPVAPRRSANRG